MHCSFILTHNTILSIDQSNGIPICMKTGPDSIKEEWTLSLELALAFLRELDDTSIATTFFPRAGIPVGRLGPYMIESASIYGEDRAKIHELKGVTPKYLAARIVLVTKNCFEKPKETSIPDAAMSKPPVAVSKKGKKK